MFVTAVEIVTIGGAFLGGASTAACFNWFLINLAVKASKNEYMKELNGKLSQLRPKTECELIVNSIVERIEKLEDAERHD